MYLNLETNMKEEDVIKLIKKVVADEIKRSQAFRTWRKFDSVTDVFSPITGNSQKIGFYGSTKVAKQTVTGSRSANAALASLLTALSTLGLITDSSS